MLTISECLELLADLWHDWAQDQTKAVIDSWQDFLMVYDARDVAAGLRWMHQQGRTKPSMSVLKERLDDMARRRKQSQQAQQADAGEAERKRIESERRGLVNAIRELPMADVRAAQAAAAGKLQYTRAGQGLVESWPLGYCVRIVRLLGMDPMEVPSA